MFYSQFLQDTAMRLIGIVLLQLRKLPLLLFPLPLVIKLLDLVLNFFFFLLLVKRQKNASPSSEAILSVFTMGELVMSLKNKLLLWQDTLLNVLSDVATFLAIIIIATATEHHH